MVAMAIQPSFPTGQSGGYSAPNNGHIIGRYAERVIVAVASNVMRRRMGRLLLDNRPEMSQAVPSEKKSNNGNNQMPSTPVGDMLASR